MRKIMLFCGILFFPLTGNSLSERIVWCQNDSFSAPKTAQTEVWCAEGIFSAPEAVAVKIAVKEAVKAETEVWCVDEVWHHNAQQDTVTFQKEERLDSIVVSSNRANMNTPVTYTQITRKQLQRESATHSLPMMLALQPSVVATTEGGLGLGRNYS